MNVEVNFLQTLHLCPTFVQTARIFYMVTPTVRMNLKMNGAKNVGGKERQVNLL